MADQETTHDATTQAPAAQAPVRQRRSPGYPAIDLGTALRRAHDLYGIDSKHPIPLQAAAEEWGYSAKSSSNLTVAAALKRFGLIRDVGSAAERQFVLTDEGRELAFLDQERDSDRWRELVREAALRPKIHRQVIDHFEGALPDDRIVLRYLLFDLGFPEEATAKDFMKRLRSTVEFAGLEESAVRPASDPAESDERAGAPQSGLGSLPQVGAPAATPAGDSWPGSSSAIPPEPITSHSGGGGAQVQIPYSHDRWATLHAAFPVTEREWDAMIAMLQAMKPGLVRAEPAPASDGAAALTGDPDRDDPL